MSDSTSRFTLARLAKAIAMTLAMSVAASPNAKADENKTETSTEALKEEERKRKKKQSALDPANAQTEKIKAGLPDLGNDDGTKEAAAKNKARVDAAASTLTRAVVSAAQGAQHDQGGDFDAGKAIGTDVLNASLASGVSALKSGNLPFLGNLTGSVNVRDGGVDYTLQTVGVLFGKGKGHNLLGQVGVHNEMSRPTANVGLVWRYINDAETYLLGTNVFYDHDFEAGAHRLGVGAEAAT